MISDPFQIVRETWILFEEVQQVERAHARRTNPVAVEIFPDGDACGAACADPGLPLVPARPRLFRLLEFRVDLGLPVHGEDYNLGVIIDEMSYCGCATVR